MIQSFVFQKKKHQFNLSYKAFDVDVRKAKVREDTVILSGLLP